MHLIGGFMRILISWHYYYPKKIIAFDAYVEIPRERDNFIIENEKPLP
jgi:hypothetical protein